MAGLGPCPVTGEGFCACDDVALSDTADDPGKLAAHQAMIDLLAPEDATHVAVSSGDWSDPATWADGRVPDQDADVFIPRDIAVRYDVSSDAELHIVRVDGQLNFATDTDTKLVLETMITNFASTLTVGTREQPVEVGVSAEIIIADTRSIWPRIRPRSATGS